MPRCLFFAVFLLVIVLAPIAESHASEPEPGVGPSKTLRDFGENLGGELIDDGSYLFHSVVGDIGDMLKLPFHAGEVGVKDVLTAAVVLGTIPAMIYGLDNPLRRNTKNIPDRTAGDLVTIGTGVTEGSLGLVYGWGLLFRNDEARHAALTGIEGVGLSSLLTIGAKAAFGRLRPREEHGPRAFFKGGSSFVSGAATPTFAAAAAISEGFDNRWWVAVPAYSFALMTGVGRMGKDAHWASDVLGSAIIGAATTELLFYLHRKREQPTSLIILPMVTDRGVPAGASLGFTW